jgi:hypothetical protein
VQCEESITGLQGGRVGSAMHPELVVATYTVGEEMGMGSVEAISTINFKPIA